MSSEAQALSADSVSLVREWLTASEKIKVPQSAKLLAALLEDPQGLDFAVGFVDQVVRPEDPVVAAHHLALLGKNPPKFLPLPLRAALRLGARLAPLQPRLVVPIARRVLRELVAHLIVDATPKALTRTIAKLQRSGAQLNLNLLGEAVLGDREASRRLERTLELLRRPDVDYVSLKVSATLAPQQRWAFDETVEMIVSRLEPLFRFAAASETTKFINLDMEEYKDLELTLAVFMALLERPEYLGLRAGIVIQTYLPDAMGAMQRLQSWAAQRVARGGAPIKVRVVKGANLPMEVVDAELHDWPLATVASKREADTNYLRVLDYGLDPARIKNVELGIAGHNLFDIALAWLLAQKRQISHGIDFEMLIGMAPGQAEAVRSTVGDLLLYVPVVHPAEFDVAIAYLIRRLEEGASQDNFMSAVFQLSSNEALFDGERSRFEASLAELDYRVVPPNRTADTLASPGPGYHPTPDSDPAVMANQAWARGLREQMAHNDLGQQLRAAAAVDEQAELDLVLDRATASHWPELAPEARAAILHAAGEELARRRGDLITIAGTECGKTIDQSDTEVSEACDFAHYYAESALKLGGVDGATPTSPGVVVVTPPWNFPIAIPTGSVLAALAAGASVILKPAPQAERCAAVIVECLRAAGIEEDALALVVLPEDTLGSALIADSRVGRVILTGAYDTASLFKQLNPRLALMAETSGKNAIIVTPSADYDLAVRDVVASAFGHAGQKCSAASLVVLVGSVAKSKRFHHQLLDAVRSVNVGEPTAALSQVGPLTQPAHGKLLAGLTTLEPGQKWLVEPRQLDEQGKLWRPGVRTGVAVGSEFHQIEYFGPLLGVMTVDSLAGAIEVVNDVRFGLTSGLHSLDDEEISTWLDQINCGNLYVNRGITGAIVQRQPFGGWKRSVVGATTKAGGPNYLFGIADWEPSQATQLVEPTDAGVLELLAAAEGLVDPTSLESLRRAAASDEYAWQTEYSLQRDVQGLHSECNVLRYRPFAEQVTIRLAAAGELADLIRVLLAARRAGKPPVVSTHSRLPKQLAVPLKRAGARLQVSPDAEFAAAAAELLPAGRLRLLGGLQNWPARADLAIYQQPVTESGRLELLPFLAEQAVSITAHRFGTPKPVPLRID